MLGTIKLLRIYTDESAYFGEQRVYEVIATRVRDFGLEGATVVQALFGFGRGSHERRRHVLEDEQSLIIEVIDDEARLRDFVAQLSDMPGIGLITMEAVEVLYQGAMPSKEGTGR